MKEIRKHQIIPNDWEKREVLREKGQFWTPSWVASAMLTYVIKSSRIVFDPATGKGAFFEALISIETNHNEDFEFYGCDIDEKVFEYGVYNQGNCELEIRDFILNPPSEKFSAIVANPPYIRHHRLSKEIKCKLKEISNSILGFKIDGRAGLHIYFLLIEPAA